MKTRLELAHEWYMKHSRGVLHINSDIVDAWQYADAMLAENEKREQEEGKKKRAEMRELLNANNTFVEKEGQHFDDVEWQPDWSQAPDWANWWLITSRGSPAWVDSEPVVSNLYDGWLLSGRRYLAPSFGYTGDWRDSLRKRPV